MPIEQYGPPKFDPKESAVCLDAPQKRALLDILQTAMVTRTKLEVDGRCSEEACQESDSLRVLMRNLAADLNIDIGTYAPPETLLFIGLSDCLTDGQLKELAETKEERKWEQDAGATAKYLLSRREKASAL